jgi:hypothetical protein
MAVEAEAAPLKWMGMVPQRHGIQRAVVSFQQPGLCRTWPQRGIRSIWCLAQILCETQEIFMRSGTLLRVVRPWI